MLAIGKAIRKLRKLQGISQQDLAARADITPSFLSLVEKEKRRPSLVVTARIAEALGVSAEVLIWEAVELPSSLSDEERRVCDFAKLVVRRVYESAGRTADNRATV